MNGKILVTYASRTGSTVGVADAIGTTLTKKGAQVDVCPMHDVKDLTPYWAVIAGSAVQNRQWLPDAVEFIKTHRIALNQKRFAIFSVCMTLAMKNGEKYRPEVMKWLTPVRTLVQPVSEGLFAGALDIHKIPSFGDRLKFRMSVVFGVWSEGDHRDWNAIHGWADGLYPQFF
jgi:menaquinone-dependent protoporphyrinogen oxidase